MADIRYTVDDGALDPASFVAMANRVWPGNMMCDTPGRR